VFLSRQVLVTSNSPLQFFDPPQRHTSRRTMGRLSRASLALALFASVLTPAVAESDLVRDSTEKPLTGEDSFDKAACPNYAHYAAFPQ